MKKELYLAMVIFASHLVLANVVIEQVLYDPIGTESGGEAVELRNIGQIPVDISGWVLATDNSASDAILPQGTILMGNEAFLLTDEGWDDSKDNPAWRSANYEEKITLGNSNGGLALLYNGTIIDAVGWGNATVGLYSLKTAQRANPGKALRRISNTGDNSLDFIETVPDFFEGLIVPISAEVLLSVPAFEVSKSINMSPEGVLFVRNNKDEAIGVRIVLNDFYSGDRVISKDDVLIDKPLVFSLGPMDEYKAKLRLSPKGKVVPGFYSSSLRVIIEE